MIISWGKSMYGGWYIDYHLDGQLPNGKHFKTMSELKQFAKEHDMEIGGYNRLDN